MDNLTFAYVLIAIGLIVLMAGFFIPSGGLLFGAAGIFVLVGVGMVFAYGDSLQGTLTLLGLAAGLPVLWGVFGYIWPHTPVGRRYGKQAVPDATIATMPVNLELEQLRGRYGRTLSPMRPSGSVDFDGRRIDAMSEGMMLDANQWVKCVDVRAGRVIVRLADKPNLDDIELKDFSE
jgi:membrane-bound serine protease (ClpP class)